MELNSHDVLVAEDVVQAQDVAQYASSKRIHTFLMVPHDSWEKLQLLIEEKRAEASKDISLFELLRPMPEEFLTDVDNDEYKNKPDRDVGDVAVVVVDGILHDTKRSVWISKNWGCEIPSSILFVQPGQELSLNTSFPEAPADFISGVKSEIDSSCNRLDCKKGEVGFIHIVSNGVPSTFFEYLSDSLSSKFEFVSIDSFQLREEQPKFYDVVKRGRVSDWGLSMRRKPFTLENYSISSIFIKIFLVILVLYLLYSYTFGA